MNHLNILPNVTLPVTYNDDIVGQFTLTDSAKKNLAHLNTVTYKINVVNGEVVSLEAINFEGDNRLVIDIKINQAISIFQSDLDWEIKYDKIFSMGIWQLIRQSGYSFEWDDPDTTYEEDLTAYVIALEEFWRTL